MSSEATRAAFTHSQQEGTTLLLLLAIAEDADPTGARAYPSEATLARRIRRTERQVRTLVGRLVAAGELDVLYKQGPHGCNVYRILLPMSGCTRKPGLPGRDVDNPVDNSPHPEAWTSGLTETDPEVFDAAPGSFAPPTRKFSAPDPEAWTSAKTRNQEKPPETSLLLPQQPTRKSEDAGRVMEKRWADLMGQRYRPLTAQQQAQGLDLERRAAEQGKPSLVAEAMRDATANADGNHWRYFVRTAEGRLAGDDYRGDGRAPRYLPGTAEEERARQERALARWQREAQPAPT